MVKLGSVLVTLIFLVGIVCISDKLLLRIIQRNAEKGREKVLGQYFGNIAEELNNTNIGSFISESSLILDSEKRLAHHDNKKDHIVRGKGNKNLWIIGDSWGGGLKDNEIQNSTISTKLNGDFSNIRFIQSNSWSPLLFTIAYSHRVKIYGETPDFVVFFIDQTDIGDDYCRYRPYVLRDEFSNLLGVFSISNLSNNEYRWVRHVLLRKHSSGIKLALQRIMHYSYYKFIPNIVGLTSCDYDEVISWQTGSDYSPSGTPTKKFYNYFKNTLGELGKTVIKHNKKTRVLYVTHDWAQHDLSYKNKKRFARNIKTIVSDYSDVFNGNSIHLHVSTSKYGDIDPKQIYKYPFDKFSHLWDYSLLSDEIASFLKMHFKIGK